MLKRRTCYCGNISREHLGKEVALFGWVHKVRNHGGVVFIDLRDREGIVQVVIEESASPEAYNIAEKLKPEYVIGLSGTVRERPKGTENPKLKTGYYEVAAKKVEILNTSDMLPFPVDEETPLSEEVRLKHRYLDLRRRSMTENMLFRHKFYQTVRYVFNKNDFVEIETPILTKSTPEGARDYIVPSRQHPGKFYALPQSPQLFKQILMISGFDRYYQIVKCLRDEDLRADRQPEFTQIDFEMSFVDEDDVMSFSEELVHTLFKELLGVELKRPFDRIPYKQAMENYGSDKPDRRFGVELIEMSDVFKDSQFKIFREAVESGGVVKAINFRSSNLSRKEIDELSHFAQTAGAKGLAWIKVEDGKLNSPIVRFLAEGEKQELMKRAGANVGDTILLSADKKDVVFKVLGSLRLYIAKKYSLIDTNKYDIFWVVDFPLMEWDEEEGRFVSLHHPFTLPREEDIPKLLRALQEEDFEERKKLVQSVRARAYDMVINGYEVGGGSIRINRREIQEVIFKLLDISQIEAEEKFGFLLRALNYGAPPHGGLAFGLDRLVSIMRGLDSIRDTIAFPKTQRGICPLTGAPDYVSPKQLKEVHIKVLE